MSVPEKDTVDFLRWRLENAKLIGFFIAGITFILGFGVAMFIGQTAGEKRGRESCRREAVEHGYAQYNSISGTWEWRDPKAVEFLNIVEK